MPKNFYFSVLKKGHRYKYGLEVIYLERHIPTKLSIFFSSISYRKIEGRGFVVDSEKTSCYNFDYPSGNLQYLSHHKGDFTRLGFSWADTRIAQFEFDKIKDEHRGQAEKTAQRVYEYLKEQRVKTADPRWREKYEPFLSPLERILGKK